MLFRCQFIVLFLSALLGNWLFSPVAGQTQAPPMLAAPPQQMTPYGPAPNGPATYPSTTYPATAASPPASAALPPYDSIPSALMAQVPSGAGGTAGPAVIGDPSFAGDTGALHAPGDTGAFHAPYDPNAYGERSLLSEEPWTWQMLPNGLMYKSYLAGGREPRIASQWVHERNLGWRWDATLGGRVGLLRYGTDNDFWPQGWQLDVEGAAFPRLDLDHLRDLDTVDFRAGAPLTTRQGPLEFKFGYYHLSSHLGDEFVLRNPGISRTNYVRESLVSGLAVYMNPSLRLYSEVGYAFYVDGGAKPWEFQFRADFSPAEPTGPCGAPFLAINGHLREENDFGGNLAVQTGWQWRGRSGHLLRFGMHYFNGMSDQAQFFNRFEEQIGAGLWYDY